MQIVFKDNSFANDALKDNIEQIFKQLNPNTEIKII